MLKEYFKKPEQLEDYRKTVDFFNKNNYIKIGDKIFVELSFFDKKEKYTKKGIKLKLTLKEKKVVEVRVDLGLYGLSDDTDMFGNNYSIGKYEFQPVFIIGDEVVPEKGEEYGKRVFWTGFSITKNKKRLPSYNRMRFDTMEYRILDTQEEL